MGRIAFPYGFEGGRLSIATGVEAGQQALQALMSTHTGELPMNRDYGADLEYNIPLDLATQQQQRLQQQIGTYHPNIQIRAFTPLLGEEGTVIDWRTEVVIVQ